MAGTVFDRASLRAALSALGERAFALGKTIEISIYGGSALMLTFEWRQATRDVDAVFEPDRELVRRLAAELAVEYGWDKEWLNDGVKGFLSPVDGAPHVKEFFATFPDEDRPGLRILIASPRYLFAMKCLAMRLAGEDARDLADIRALAHEIGVRTSEQALDIVASFYPGRAIPAKTQFGIEELFAP